LVSSSDKMKEITGTINIMTLTSQALQNMNYHVAAFTNFK